MSASTNNDLCIIVPSSFTSKFREFLRKHHLQDPSRLLLKDVSTVAVPVRLPDCMDERQLKEMLSSCPELQNCFSKDQLLIQRQTLPQAKKLTVKKPEKVLKENLTKLLSEKGIKWTDIMEKDLPTSWERHGDLILVPSSAFSDLLWQNLGDCVWSCVVQSLSCQRLARKDTVSTNGYRTPQVALLYGNDGWVRQVDNGITYTYDVTKCMFSSGNISEKLRVATFQCENEVVVDMYAGIGYFTLPYLLYTGAKHLHACEWNPDAVEALQRNLDLNHVADRCTVHCGDNRQMCPRAIADRVNLGLIPSSREGWATACAALKPHSGGTLHIHYNVNTKAGKQTVTSLPEELFRQEARIQTCCHGDGWERSVSFKDGSVKSVDLVSDADEKEQSRSEEDALPARCRERRNNSDGTSMTVDNNDMANNARNDASFTKISSENCDHENRSSSSDDVHSYTTMYGEFENLNEFDLMSAQSRENLTSTHYHSNYQHCIQTSQGSTSPQTSNEINTKPSLTVASGPIDWKANLNENKKSKLSKWLPWAIEVSIEIKTLLEKEHGGRWTTEILHIEHVKSYAPHVDHVVLDLKCKPSTE